MKNGEVVLMMQQLSFSPVENILTVLIHSGSLSLAEDFCAIHRMISPLPVP